MRVEVLRGDPRGWVTVQELPLWAGEGELVALTSSVHACNLYYKDGSGLGFSQCNKQDAADSVQPH